MRKNQIEPFTFGLEFMPTWKVCVRIIVFAAFSYWLALDEPYRPDGNVIFCWLTLQFIMILLLGWHLGEFVWRLKGSIVKKINLI